jgi:hypothetical protein
MNDAFDIKVAVGLALVLGLLIGAVVTGLMASLRPPATVAPNEDTELLDFLDDSQCHLFFNTKVDNGAWGMLDADNNMLSVGYTVRQAIQNARLHVTEKLANAVGVNSEAS